MTAESKKYDQLREICSIKKGSDRILLNVQIKVSVFLLFVLPFHHYLFQSMKNGVLSSWETYYFSVDRAVRTDLITGQEEQFDCG